MTQGHLGDTSDRLYTTDELTAYGRRRDVEATRVAGAPLVPDRNRIVPERTFIAEVKGMLAPAAGSVPGKWMYSKCGPTA